jgi:predicted phosphodiesterase
MLDNLELIKIGFPERKNIILYPLGDVHLSSFCCQEEKFAQLIAKIASEENAYVVIIGDMLDNATKSAKVGTPWDNKLRPSEAKRLMANYLEPIRPKILGCTSGNHEAGRNKDVDDDPMYDICCKLDIEDRYRPSMAFIHLKFGAKNGGNLQNPAYNICITHGAGSSIYVGGSSAKGERFISATDVDLLISGHTHKPADIPGARFKVNPSHGRVFVEPWRYVICSSWLDYTDYAAKAMLSPTANVEQKIIIHGSEKRIDVIQST